MALQPHTTANTASAVPVDLEHLRHYVAALAERIPVLLGAHPADRQMVLHLLDEQIAYLHARRRHMLVLGTHDLERTQHWCVVSLHLEAVQKVLSSHTTSVASYNSSWKCNLPYSPTLSRLYPLDFYIPLETTSR